MDRCRVRLFGGEIPGSNSRPCSCHLVRTKRFCCRRSVADHHMCRRKARMPGERRAWAWTQAHYAQSQKSILKSPEHPKGLGNGVGGGKWSVSKGRVAQIGSNQK